MNDNQLFKQHFKENSGDAVAPTIDKQISNAQWYSDYKTHESGMALKYQHLYDSSQKRTCDTIFREQKKPCSELQDQTKLCLFRI